MLRGRHGLVRPKPVKIETLLAAMSQCCGPSNSVQVSGEQKVNQPSSAETSRLLRTTCRISQVPG